MGAVSLNSQSVSPLLYSFLSNKIKNLYVQVIQGDGIVSNLGKKQLTLSNSIYVHFCVCVFVDYHASGNYLVMSTSESAIHLIDTVSGAEKKKVYAKNCGIGQLKYTHHETCILMSMKNNHDIGYLCLHDNRYIRHFKTHTAEVTSLSMNPANDQFISASNDRSVCLWDLSSPNPTARIQLPQHYDQPSCAFDSAGLVFGILAQDSRRGTPSLKLFDSRNYQGGPFANIFPSSALIERSLANKSFNVSQVHKMLQSNWTDFEFSGDGGQSVLVNNNSEALLILDGYRFVVDFISPLFLNATMHVVV